MKHNIMYPNHFHEKIEELEKRVRELETREIEVEDKLRKLSDDVLTADNYHEKIQAETRRHDF